MRLFIAMSFPEAVLRPVNERTARVKSKLPPAAWVRPESQHLTFAFLGEHEESLIDMLAPLVERSVATVKKFEGTLTGCGFFPNPRHARVGWIGVRPEASFNGLAKAVRDAVQQAGVTLDRGEFRAHLTLMRIRDPWPPACIETFNGALRDYISAPFAVERVTLYSSRLDPSGAVHTPLRQFALSSRA